MLGVVVLGAALVFNYPVSVDSDYVRLADDVVPSGVDALATACPTCHVNLRHASVKKSLGRKIYDIMEIIAKSIMMPKNFTLYKVSAMVKGEYDMQLDDLYLKVVRQLEKRADAKTALRNKRLWHKEPGYRSYGIGTPELRELIKSYLSRFKQLSLEERFELARMFYKSGFSEQATFGNAVLELSVGGITSAHFDFLDEIVSYFNNWATTDWFCIRVFQPLLRKYPEEILNLVGRWNRSKNMWKRRASIVTFVRKIGASGKFTGEVLRLCDNLIWDKEDLVQKAVGWALKDNVRGAKKRVLDYVKSLRRKGVSSTITLYAIRDLKDKEREEVLKIKPLRS